MTEHPDNQGDLPTIRELIKDSQAWPREDDVPTERGANAKTKRQRKWLRLALGGVSATSGASIIAYHHKDYLKSYAKPETLGWMLAVFGIGLISPVDQMFSTKRPRGRTYLTEDIRSQSMAMNDPSYTKFEFKLLNDRYWTDRAHLKYDLDVELEELCLPEEMVESILQREEKEREFEETEARKRLEKTAALVEKLTKEGKSTKEIKGAIHSTVYVIDFCDDAQGHEDQGPLDEDEPEPKDLKGLVKDLSDIVTFLLQIATVHDQVVIRLTSPGGPVPEYGLASSQLLRLKKAGIKCTVCVDTIAASGGYMMACVADEIVAAPFSFIGSIGVVAELPNFAKVLKKLQVDYMLFTAGNQKRTVHHLAETTEENKEMFQGELDAIHFEFKDLVSSNRKNIDVSKVGTGQAWLATQAKQMGLVDVLMTSDEFISEKAKTQDVVLIRPKREQPTSLAKMVWDTITANAQPTKWLSGIKQQMVETLTGKTKTKTFFQRPPLQLKAKL